MRMQQIVRFVLLALAAATSVASAHPMGNFSINHYASLHVEHGDLLLRYRIDLAEIPTAQEMPSLDTDDDGTISDAERAAYLAAKSRVLAANLQLLIDGRPIALSAAATDLQVRPGAGDLPTLLLTLDFRLPLSAAPAPAGTRCVVQYRDGNYPERAGWREITCGEGTGCRIIKSTGSGGANVSRSERSGGLTVYPTNPTEAPPQERDAHLVVLLTEAAGGVAAGGAAVAVQPAPTAPAPTVDRIPARNTATPQDRFTSLIAIRSLSPAILALSLGLAFVLGSFHALAPGHGKTVVAAYLVGSRGTPRHALLLGLVVTITHVIGVFALGLLVLAASKYVIPEQLYPWLGYASGLLIVAIGLWQFSRRYAIAWLRLRQSSGDGAPVTLPGHRHGPGGHNHNLPDRLTPASLIALGVSGGILPCPSALIVMLSAIALHRIAFGLLLILVFSFGLAAVLIAIGLLMLYARRIMGMLKWEGRLLSRMPLVSPLFVAALGVVIIVQSLRSAGILPGVAVAAPTATRISSNRQ